MFVTRLKSCALAICLTLAGASLAAAQDHGPLLPFESYPFEQNFQPFAAPEITNFGRGTQPIEGYFFNYDRLNWSFSSPNVRPFGSKSAEGFYGSEFSSTGQTFQTNDLDSSVFDTQLAWGHRYEFGYVRDRQGWLASGLYGFTDVQNFDREAGPVDLATMDQETAGAVVLFNDPNSLLSGFQDANEDGIDDDLNGNHIFGRDGEDLGSLVDGTFVFGADDPTAYDGIPDDLSAANDTGDGFRFVPRFDSIRVRQETSLSGIEIMRVHRLRQEQDRGLFEILYGVRFVRLKDKLFIRLDGGNLADTSWDTTVDNVIVGPQIGGRWVHRYGRFRMGLEGRFLAGFNIQQGKQDGTFASFANGSGDLDQLFSNSFDNSFNSKEWSPTGEFRANLSYQVSKAVNIRAGWTALYMDGVARAIGVQEYSLPSMGLNESNNREAVFIQGLNIGLEINH